MTLAEHMTAWRNAEAFNRAVGNVSTADLCHQTVKTLEIEQQTGVMYMIVWRSLVTGVQDHGAGRTLPLAVVQKAVDQANLRYAGQIYHWIEQACPSVTVTADDDE